MYDFGWYNLEMDAWVNHEMDVESCLYLPEGWICLNQAWALLGYLCDSTGTRGITNVCVLREEPLVIWEGDLGQKREKNSTATRRGKFNSRLARKKKHSTVGWPGKKCEFSARPPPRSLIVRP